MKIKMIVSVLLIAVSLFFAFGFYQAQKLRTIHITKTTTIQGNEQEVFDMVRYLNNFPKWSPFLVADPQQQYEVKGKDGEIGAQYHWVGNNGKDVGYQEIINIDAYKSIGMKCFIEKPFTAQPTFDYNFENTTNGVVVKQNFVLKSDITSAFFMWLFGAKKEMEKTNETGLALLKKQIEN